MRIIGGRFRGKRLCSPKDASVRPTSDRAREALFNVLEHQGRLGGAAFLDLFCGTAAVGLEAFSRGALKVWLMDKDTRLAAINLRSFGSPPAVRLFNQRVLGSERPACPFDIVFLDPPYGQGLLVPTLTLLRRGWLGATSCVVAELEAKEPFSSPAGFVIQQERRYGNARMVFLDIDPAFEEDRP